MVFQVQNRHALPLPSGQMLSQGLPQPRGHQAVEGRHRLNIPEPALSSGLMLIPTFHCHSCCFLALRLYVPNTWAIY